MEEWKPIPQYYGIYEASNRGRIRSLDGKITANARYDRRVWRGRIMRQKVTANRKGRKDARVCLWRDGKEKTHLVARLVASEWIGEPTEGMTVNHINGNPLDNRPENLEWITLAENIRRGFADGLYASTQHQTTLVPETGEAIVFPSAAETERWLGRSHGYIHEIKQRGGTTATSRDGRRFRVV